MRRMTRVLMPKLSASLVVLTAACGQRSGPTLVPEVVIDTTGLPGVSAEYFAAHDTTLLGAVARTLADTFATVSPVRIDPRRLPELVDWPATARVIVDTGQRRATLDDLRSAALRLMPALNCPLALSSSGSREGCPRRQFELVVLGVPRQGPPEKQRDRSGVPPIGLTPSSWTVRVVQSTIGPTGYVVQSIDYAYERHGTSWLYLGRIGLAFIE